MIQLRGASYRYPHAQDEAVVDVTMDMAPGEVVGIVGPNGSGKSTVGRLIKGLLIPARGGIVVDGLDTREHALEVRRLVGLVFQNPDNQIVNSTVAYEVAFGPENLGLPSSEVRDRVKRALEAVGMGGHGDDECHSLSMAQKQRVSMASVIAMAPRYVVLDEPTAWIEPRDRWPLLHSIVEWGRGEDVGLVLITHRMEEAALCARLYGMRDGRIEASGPPARVLGDASTRARLALEVPETMVLAAELRAEGISNATGAGGVEGLAAELWGS